MSIYEELIEAGVKVEGRYSDLMCPVNEVSRAIVFERANRAQFVNTFICNITGALWYEIPMCFDPYWVARLCEG